MHEHVTQYQVVNFGQHVKKRKPTQLEDHAHSCIILTTSKGRSLTFDDTKNSKDGRPKITENSDGTYSFHEHSWVGLPGQKGKPKHKIGIDNLIEFASYLRDWEDTGARYPKNCRGYVHAIIAFLGNNPYSNVKCDSVALFLKNKKFDFNLMIKDFNDSQIIDLTTE